MAPGVHMYTTDQVGSAGYDEGDYNYNFNGTSSATPVVAGVAALLLGQDPSMTAAEVEAQLMATADDLGAARLGSGDRVRSRQRLPGRHRDSANVLPVDPRSHGLGADPTVIPPSSPGCSAGEFFAETPVTLTAAPSAGWMVSGWTGTDNDGSTAISNTLTMPASAHSAGVEYSQIPCYTISLSHTGMGADPFANPASSPGCGQGGYHSGESVTLTASPMSGWAVSGWSGTDDDDQLRSRQYLDDAGVEPCGRRDLCGGASRLL